MKQIILVLLFFYSISISSQQLRLGVPVGNSGIMNSANYICDERFSSHYQDNDFVLSLEKMKKENCNLKSGIAYNSRVDHMGGRTYKNVKQDYFNLEGKNEMIKKWGKY